MENNMNINVKAAIRKAYYLQIMRNLARIERKAVMTNEPRHYFKARRMLRAVEYKLSKL